jgi:hypothetical protein
MISIAPKSSMQSDNWPLDEVEFGLHVAINLNSKVRPPHSRHWQPLENDSQSNPPCEDKILIFFFFFNESAFTNAIANMDTAEVSISNYAKSVVSMRSLLGKG